MTDRGASDVIGFALVFGLVVTSVAIVSVSGVGSLENARDAEQLENAERAFDVLADNVADLHQRNAPSRATEISLGEAQLQTGDKIQMNVSIHRTGETDPTPITNRTIRPIVYSGNQERQLVYEGGAVFRENRDGGVLVREPPFVVNDDRVLVPILALRSQTVQSHGGSTVLVRTDHRRASIQHASTDSGIEKVIVEIESPRAYLWEEYFEGNGFNCSSPGTELECAFEPGPEIERVYVVDHDIKVEINS